MSISVQIDEGAGFCGGVIRAIQSAERFLAEHPGEPIYSLGSIVHNDEELARLRSEGLGVMTVEQLERASTYGDEPSLGEGRTILIRAHGEPPRTYELSRRLGFRVIDCTCPVVLGLQHRISEAYGPLKSRGGQLLIFGKTGHAEVLGLLGQVGGDALVVDDLDSLISFAQAGMVHYDRPIEIFSQTTKSPREYEQLCAYIGSQMSDPQALTVHDSICRQVATRHERLLSFAREHDVVIFVCGAMSSNGAVLSQLCRSVNPRTYTVESPSEIRGEWLRDGDRVGVSGATSTPQWLLEQVASALNSI